MTPDEVADYERQAAAEHTRLKKAGRLQYLTAADLHKTREEAARR